MNNPLWVFILVVPYLVSLFYFFNKIKNVPVLGWDEIKIPFVFLFLGSVPINLFFVILSSPYPQSINMFEAMSSFVLVQTIFGLIFAGIPLLREVTRRTHEKRKKKDRE